MSQKGSSITSHGISHDVSSEWYGYLHVASHLLLHILLDDEDLAAFVLLLCLLPYRIVCLTMLLQVVEQVLPVFQRSAAATLAPLADAVLRAFEHWTQHLLYNHETDAMQ